MAPEDKKEDQAGILTRLSETKLGSRETRKDGQEKAPIRNLGKEKRSWEYRGYRVLVQFSICATTPHTQCHIQDVSQRCLVIRIKNVCVRETERERESAAEGGKEEEGKKEMGGEGRGRRVRGRSGKRQKLCHLQSHPCSGAVLSHVRLFKTP